MKCTRCGSNLNAGAPFCLQCGTMAAGPRSAAAPVGALAVPQTFARPVHAAAGRRGGMAAALWILGALAVVVAAGTGLHSAGLLPPLRPAAVGVSGGQAPEAPLMTRNGVPRDAGALQAAGAALPEGALRLAAGSDPHGLLEAQGTGGQPPVLQTQGETPPPMLRADGAGSPPSLARDEAGMPDALRNYLEHVRRCENQRMQMAAAQVAEAVGLLTDLQSGAGAQGLFDDEGPRVENTPPPTRRVTDQAGAMRGTWEGLVRAFNSVPPPYECTAIRATYDQVLRETAIMISEITRAVDQAANDRQRALQALMSLQGRSGSRIDRPARETDAQIQGLCDRYRTRKWFEITADVGGGMLGRGF